MKYRLVEKRGKIILQVSYKTLTGSRPEDLEETTAWRNAKVEDLSSGLLKTLEEL